MLAGDLLAERARLSPGRTALVIAASDERVSYAALDRRVAATARALRDGCRLAKGDRVGLLAENRIEFVELFFAAARAGLVLVPLSTRATPYELAHIAADSGMRLLIHDRVHASHVEQLRALTPIHRVLALDPPPLQGDTLLEELRTASTPSGFASEPTGGEDLLCLLYTSGTTGKPKGVMIPHRMVWWNGFNTVASWQLREDDVSPIFTPLYHAGGLAAFLVPILTIGGTIVLHAGFDPAEVWRTIVRERCTVVLGVPTIWKRLLEAPEFQDADLSHVRWFISGGAPLPLYLIEAYQRRGVVFKQGYGLTEVGVNCFAMDAAESRQKPGSIGKPMLFTEATLLDADGRAVGPGEVGELCLRGPHVCSGYWNNAAAGADAIDRDGFFHTGDLARRDQDGFYTIAGRKKDMFISGGVNVYPAEIEGELLLHPDIGDAAVVGMPDATWGEVGVAFIVWRQGAAATVSPSAGAELATFLGGRLARHKIPKRFIAVDALPRTAYGKVLKGELRDGFVREHPEGVV